READRPLDVRGIAADVGAMLVEDARRPGDGLEVATRVPGVRMPGDRSKRLRRAAAADQDRESMLDRERPADRILQVISGAFVGDRLAVQQPPDDPDRLVEPGQPLAGGLAEIEAEGVVL